MVCANCASCIFDNPNIPNDMHEIHITVDDADVEGFRAVCGILEVKPVLIDMQNDGGTFQHLMTSYTMRGDPIQAYEKACQQRQSLWNWGYTVSRVKIETTLTNPIAAKIQPGQYFESHIEIIIPWIDFLVDGWDDMVSKVRQVSPYIRLSRNAFKKNDEMVSYFATIRDIGRPAYFDQLVNRITEGLSEHFKIGKVRSEFAWYDTNINLDNEWRTV